MKWLPLSSALIAASLMAVEGPDILGAPRDPVVEQLLKSRARTMEERKRSNLIEGNLFTRTPEVKPIFMKASLL